MTRHTPAVHKPELVARPLLIALALAPAVYVFAVIQYSAITVPFWDHTELIKVLDAYKNDTFRLDQLWAPHNHSRPLTYRVIYVLNALLTGWDVRSEYVYMYAAIYGAFLLHVRMLWQHRGRRVDLTFLCLLVVLAAFYFSPVGHNNHWWSMMLQLNLTNLFVILALWQICRDPKTWGSNVCSALYCWLASYTLTNGLIAIVACAIIALLPTEHRRAFVSKLIFWAASLTLLLLFYLPGLPDEGGRRPEVLDVLWFAIVYVGSPVGSFLNFRFSQIFSVIESTRFNGLVGLVMIAAAAVLAVRAWTQARQSDSASLFLLGSLAFVGGSALATGWARTAFDEFGVANANSSRYVIFSSYFVFGAVHYYARHPLFSQRDGVRRSIPILIMAAIVSTGTATYWRGLRVYESAHQFNRTLIQAYLTKDPIPDSVARQIYPDAEFTRYLRESLRRNELGPYRDRLVRRVEVPSAPKFVRAVALHGGVQLVQRIAPTRNRLVGLELRLVTFGGGSRGTATWELLDVATIPPTRVGAGAIHGREVGDWLYVRLPLSRQENSKGRTYDLVVRAPADVRKERTFGIPLFAVSNGLQPALIIQSPSSMHEAEGMMALVLRYDE